MILRLKDLVRFYYDNDEHVLRADITPYTTELLRVHHYFNVFIENGVEAIAIRITDSDEFVIIIIPATMPKYAMVTDGNHYLLVPFKNLSYLTIAKIEKCTIYVGLEQEDIEKYRVK